MNFVQQLKRKQRLTPKRKSYFSRYSYYVQLAYHPFAASGEPIEQSIHYSKTDTIVHQPGKFRQNPLQVICSSRTPAPLPLSMKCQAFPPIPALPIPISRSKGLRNVRAPKFTHRNSTTLTEKYDRPAVAAHKRTYTTRFSAVYPEGRLALSTVSKNARERSTRAPPGCCVEVQHTKLLHHRHVHTYMVCTHIVERNILMLDYKERAIHETRQNRTNTSGQEYECLHSRS